MADSSVAPEVELLVACMNRSEPPPVLARLPPGADKPALLVINQCTTIDPPAELSEPGVRMISVRERGLSRSRNRALELARGKLLVFCDDDVEYLPGALASLRRGFAAHPGAAVVTFQFLTRETGKPFKRYAPSPQRHGLFSVASVSTIEIALRRDLAGHLRFDERFGLGAELASGEENIWLADALHAGLGAGYFPEPLCDHPGLSTGHRAWTAADARTKGALLRRMYPRLWPAMLGGFCVLKYPLYRDQLSPPSFLAAALAGARNIR
jgi:glycosyltransferase involved in cell wall biosynthesis